MTRLFVFAKQKGVVVHGYGPVIVRVLELLLVQVGVLPGKPQHQGLLEVRLAPPRRQQEHAAGLVAIPPVETATSGRRRRRRIPRAVAVIQVGLLRLGLVAENHFSFTDWSVRQLRERGVVADVAGVMT